MDYDFENSFSDPEYPFYVREQSEWVAKRFPKMPFKQKEAMVMEIKRAAIDIVAEENFSSPSYVLHKRQTII